MFEQTRRKVDRDVEASMQLFRRAKVGPIAAIEPRAPKMILLALDGSRQDDLSLEIARRLRRRFDCSVRVLDARDGEPEQDLAAQRAAALNDAGLTALAREEPMASFDRILAAQAQQQADLLIVPSPFGRNLEAVGPDSTGTVIDVLLARSPVPILAVRSEFEPAATPFQKVMFVLTGENEAAPLAAAWAAGATAPGGHLQLVLELAHEFYENVRETMSRLAPDVEVSPELLSESLANTHAKLHRALQKTAEQHGFSYDLQMVREGEASAGVIDGPQSHTLLVCALERDDRLSQGYVHDRIRHSTTPVLIAPFGRT